MVDLTNGDDVFTAGPGFTQVNGLDGTDTLIVNFATLTQPIRWLSSYGWGIYTDDFFNRVEYYNFERFDIRGGAGADDLRGSNLDDTLRGNGGNDVLHSGLGADRLFGGAGLDRWVAGYGSVLTRVEVVLPTGTDIFVVAATGARLNSVEALSLDTGIGNDLIDTAAHAADDVVNTGDGNDTVRLGLGFDTVNMGNGTDILVLDYSTRTSAIGVENLGYGWRRYTDGAVDEVATTATDFYSVERFEVKGGLGNDDLQGGGLVDTLSGGAGDDTLRGGAGRDIIDGGEGTDLWSADLSALLANVTVSIARDAGSTSYGAVVSGIERIDIRSGRGDDRIVARAGSYDDVIETGDGKDTITTGGGRDVVNGGNGDDRLIMNWSAETAPITLTDQGYGWWRYATGPDTQLDFYAVEAFNLTGGRGNDTLRGGGLDDILVGGAGNDILDSRQTLADTVRERVDGSSGIDLWRADLTAQLNRLIFDAAASQTTAQGAAAGLTLQRIESVDLRTGGGNDSISTRGYILTDVVETGDGDDRVDLGRGIDTANGGNGTDTLAFDWSAAGTSITRTDEGYGWMRYASGPDGDSVRYYSFEQFDLTGGAFADRLVGGNLNDSLAGSGGNDVLNGGNGIDSINGGAGVDRWIGWHGDKLAPVALTLNASGNGSLGGVGSIIRGIEAVTLTTGANNDSVNLAALAGNDSIEAGDGDDVIATGLGRDRVNGGNGTLSGGGGADLLRGGGGDDLLSGGAGGDQFYFARSEGRDRVGDAGSGDFLRIKGAAFTGSVQAGDGSTVGANAVQLSVAGGTTTLHIGLDGTPGADITIDLTGAFGIGSFSLSGSDILVL